MDTPKLCLWTHGAQSNIISMLVEQLMVLTLRRSRWGKKKLGVLCFQTVRSLPLYNKHFSVYELSFFLTLFLDTLHMI
jgi:hypothetical protein